MKSIVTLIAILISSLLIMTGCSQDPPKNPAKEPGINQTDNLKNGQIKDDLAKYTSEIEKIMKPWVKVDKLKEDLAAAKSAKGYVSIIRENFVPVVSGIIADMEAIKPATREVQAIHEAYQASLKDYLSGLQGMAVAVEKNDDKLVNEAAAKLNAIDAARAKFLADTKTLAASTAM